VISHFDSKVVGVSFAPGYPDNLHSLENLAGRAYIKGEEGLAAVLIRNPDNPFDENAIEVHIPALGDMGMIGHLPRDLSSKLAPLLDDGMKWSAMIENVYINPDHPDRPGISISVNRADNLL